ncbi:MAG: metal-dependent hydrolase [Parcubacteria group bacterium]|jgi:membrane-bound metal-dependent hydrolase YbcI (DUF457 family)
MANFKTHVGWGVIIGVSMVVVASVYSLISGWTPLTLIFVAILIGSLLPDMDLDEGVPFQILFGFLGVASAGYVFYDLYGGGQRDVLILALTAGATFIGVRFVIGEIFMRFTDHRGIWHSVPAVAFVGLATVRMMQYCDPQGDGIMHMYSSIALSIGYLGHLVLDEVYASVNLAGHSLLPKRSLGSALKFYSRSKVATFLVYSGIIYLLLFV